MYVHKIYAYNKKYMYLFYVPPTVLATAIQYIFNDVTCMSRVCGHIT